MNSLSCWRHEYPLQSLTNHTLATLNVDSLVKVIDKPIHRCGHIIDWVYVRPEHIGRLVRMSVLDTEVDGSNPGSSMLFP